MARVATLFMFLATLLAFASIQGAPAAAPAIAASAQDTGATPLHVLTGVTFHASALGF